MHRWMAEDSALLGNILRVDPLPGYAWEPPNNSYWMMLEVQAEIEPDYL